MNPIIYPCLWFNGTAKEAAEFYCSAFNNSTITSENHLVVNFESARQKFMLLNGGPQFKLNPSISFYVLCDNEEELDKVWKLFLHEGKILMPLDNYAWSKKYGWIQDRYGQSWQLALGNIEDVGQKFTPSLLFNEAQCGKAAESIEFYTSVFENSKVRGILRFEKGEPEPEGLVKHAQFNLGKNVFMVMDSSLEHGFGFNEALSFVVECDTQAEIDYFWTKLSAVPEAEQCGWLKDKFGVSWQIIPSVLDALMRDPLKAPKVVEAFMKMKKFNIEKLIQAAG
jgi:predicted 3-demethylubiquinone-9 3-methyltransferase (glyoxalase superfamily)